MSITLSEGYEPGCIGRIADLHAQYYARANGFGADFEAKVATELSQFCLRYSRHPCPGNRRTSEMVHHV
jgi:hypothetical protein